MSGTGTDTRGKIPARRERAGVPWSGRWVADALGASLLDGSPLTSPGLDDLRLADLVGLALRHNPRRVHLLVSLVLGKHIPTDPRLVYGAARLLGAMVADELRGVDSGIGRTGRRLLRAALSAGDRAAAAPDATALIGRCEAHALGVVGPVGTLVLGYAETATGLGHAVADALGADYLHSTRRPVPGVPAVAGFQEEHSHATSHLLLPGDPELLRRAAPIVLVDDELSTGRTVLNTIRALHAVHPHERYVVAALVDLRAPADRARLAEVAAELGVRIDTVALASGQLSLPADVVDRGRSLVQRARAAPIIGGRRGSVSCVPAVAGPADLPIDARHGFPATRRAELEDACQLVATTLARRLSGLEPREGGPARVLVLGYEELLHVPVRIAAHLADELSRLDPAASVRFSSTTRSPALAVDEPGYAIRTALTFASHDDPADGPGPRYAYNVACSDPAQRFTDIVLILDEIGDTPGIHAPGQLLDQLAGAADRVHVLTLASRPPVVSGRSEVPGPGAAVRPSRAVRSSVQPLRGPKFGSYPADDVGWLLTDLSGVSLEAPTEEREEAIQSGGAHYAESLPVEYQPSAEYERLFDEALAASAARMAHAVGVVTELVLAERGADVVLASLARAGTPVGVLMRRWARFAHGLDLPHYAVSIVRGRGIDSVALQYLAAHHDPSSVMFVDGWTGKGAITRELAAAVAQFNATAGLPVGFGPDLAVLADPGGCVEIFGSRADYLIPSACLNSTVSGLVSRTVLNADHIGAGQFHGAKFYAHLAGSDVSMRLIDAVVAEFPAVAAAVNRDAPRVRDSERSPTWVGERTVEEISQAYGIGNLNLIKPGVGETTRVLLRRVPWKILMRTSAQAELAHIVLLATQRGVEIEFIDGLSYACIGLIHPEFTRGATGADGRSTRG